METLKGERIYLRALEPEDLELIHTIENDESIWQFSQTQTPYSKYLIKEYLENCHKDIYEVKQLRLAVTTYEGKDVGLIDLFDFDPKNKKVGLGILIVSKARGKKYGAETMQLIIDYTFKNLGVHQIYANVLEDNEPSIKLFKSFGFEIAGLKKDWVYEDNKFKNEYLFQLRRDVY